jgi:hemerythrin-like domain-containing protein
MPVQIGAKSHAFSDPTGLLTDCHRRIEMFMRTLQQVGEVLHQPPTEDVRSSLEAALRYFEQAAPKHTADEEASLFPRMRQIDNPQVRSAFQQLDRLEADHRTAESLHSEVDILGRRYLATGTLGGADIQQFREDVAQLLSIYERHIKVEDDVVFPLAATLLPDEQKSAIAAEMASRRQS